MPHPKFSSGSTTKEGRLRWTSISVNGAAAARAAATARYRWLYNKNYTNNYRAPPPPSLISWLLLGKSVCWPQNRVKEPWIVYFHSSFQTNIKLLKFLRNLNSVSLLQSNPLERTPEGKSWEFLWSLLAVICFVKLKRDRITRKAPVGRCISARHKQYVDC